MGESRVYDFTNDTVEINTETSNNNTETSTETNQTQEQDTNNKVDLSKAVNSNEQTDQSQQQFYQQEKQYNNNNNTQYQQYNYQYNQYQQQNWQMNREVVTPDKLVLEPTTACLVSCLLAGLGQMINGQIEKGLIILFGGMIAIFLITLVTCGFGAILSPLLIVISALDAYKCAKRLQNGQSIGKYEFHIFD